MKEIKLTRGKVALVDDADFEQLSRFKWSAHESSGRFYAVRYDPAGNVKMHRQILQAPQSIPVDHRDGDGLNNQRSNLRLASASLNIANERTRPHSSQFRGVSWNKKRNRWVAIIGHRYRLHYLGSYAIEEDAARAYDAEALKRFGEFARLNFPEPGVKF